MRQPMMTGRDYLLQEIRSEEWRAARMGGMAHEIEACWGECTPDSLIFREREAQALRRVAELDRCPECSGGHDGCSYRRPLCASGKMRAETA